MSRKDGMETAESGDLADALLAGFASLDRLQERIGPLGLPLERRDPGPMWFPLSWPREADPVGLHGALVGQVASLEVRFRCDFFHYSPGSPADRLGSRPVESWLAHVTAPRAPFESRLSARHGPPKVVTRRTAEGGTTTCHAYGTLWRFFLRDAPGGFWLEHASETPAYAVPERDPEVLHAFLERLPAAIASLAGPDGWKTLAEDVPSGAGILARVSSDLEASARGACAYLSLEIAPPVDAGTVAGAWRLPAPLGVSTDVHRASWRLVVPFDPTAGNGEEGPGWTSLRFGPFRVEVALDGWPSAEEDREPARGAFAPMDLRRARASVVHVSFWQDRR